MLDKFMFWEELKFPFDLEFWNGHLLWVWMLQDAKKGVLFLDFPPVLQLQLKRFEYDFMRDTMVKVGKQNVLAVYVFRDWLGVYF